MDRPHPSLPQQTGEGARGEGPRALRGALLQLLNSSWFRDGAWNVECIRPFDKLRANGLGEMGVGDTHLVERL